MGDPLYSFSLGLIFQCTSAPLLEFSICLRAAVLLDIHCTLNVYIYHLQCGARIYIFSTISCLTKEQLESNYISILLIISLVKSWLLHNVFCFKCCLQWCSLGNSFSVRTTGKLAINVGVEQIDICFWHYLYGIAVELSTFEFL